MLWLRWKHEHLRFNPAYIAAQRRFLFSLKTFLFWRIFKPMKKGELVFSALLLPVDFVMLLAAGIATYFLRTRILSAFRPVLFQFNLPFEKYFILVLVVSLLFVASYAISGLYNLRSTRSAIREFSRIVVASSAGIMAVIIYIFLRQELFNSRFLVLGAWFLAIIFVSVGRLIMRRLQRVFISRYNFGVHKVMVIGGDDVTQRIVGEIKANPASGYRIVKHLTDPEVGEIKATAGNPGIDEVILANPALSRRKSSGLGGFLPRELHSFQIRSQPIPNTDG